MYAPAKAYLPQTMRSTGPLIMWLALCACTMLSLLLIFGGAWARAHGYGLIGLSIYQAFSHVCHQLPDRSFFLAGQPLPVCARCTGLYVGFALATLLYPLVSSLRQIEAPERKWLFLAAAPLALDFSLGFLGLWNNTHWSRFTTGILLGSVAVFYVMPGLVMLGLRISAAGIPKRAGRL